MPFASTLLGPAYFAVGATSPGTAYTDQVISVVVTKSAEALDASTMQGTNRYRVSGLTDVTMTATLLANAALVTALGALVGTNCYAAARRSTGSISSSNIEYQITGGYVESVDVVNASVGELQEVEISISGGTLVEDATP